MRYDQGDTGETDQGTQRAWQWLALAGFGAGAVIVALIAMLSTASRQRDVDLQLQERSYETMILAAALDATIANSEAALGRFVISGDENIGVVYSDDWRRAGAILERLDAASRGDRAQSGRVATLRTAYSMRGDELGSAALRTTYRQNSEALATYYRIRTSPALTTIDRQLEALTDHEREKLAQRSNAADATIRRGNLLVLALSILGIGLLVGGGFLGWRIIDNAAERRREAERSADLEDAVAARTTELRAANTALTAEMTTRESAEAKLRQAQKMEAVGQLTGGISHDFNNMLAVVLGGVELAKRRISDGRGDPVRHLDNAMEGAHRAAALTKRLLAFARAEPLLPTTTEPDQLIAEMADLIDRTLGDRIAVQHLARTEGWNVFVDGHQLENALLNLAVNARDAMVDGGTLTIATARAVLRHGDVTSLPAGDYVRISVSDTGSGMSADVLDRIFEPFFTTKVVGKGTGLGLSQVFGYVTQSGGGVTVDSVVGVGTTVSLYLPRDRRIVIAATEVDDREVAARSVRLLVVEDDHRVMAATIDALHELGHRPIACPEPAGAAALLDEYPDIDLVLSDVMMPDITGPQLIAQLRRRRPRLRAVFATGFSGDIAESAAFGSDPVLRKPFTIAALGQAVAQATCQRGDPPALVTSQAA